MTILIFLLVLFVLILVHEWGHFIVAKKTGMRVDEFGIGFPPKLFGIQKGETEYTFNLLPIGGFVKIFGENADDAAAKAASGSSVDGSFTSKSKWAQMAVLLAGITMNIIFAWFLFAFAFMIGVPTAVDEGSANANARLVITDVLQDAPAADASIPSGVTITQVRAGDDVLQTLTPSNFKQFTQDHADKGFAITYSKNTQTHTAHVIPHDHVITDTPNEAAIGVALSLVQNESRAPLPALRDAAIATYNTTVAIVVGLTHLLVNSVQGRGNFSQVAGPVGIVNLVGDAASFGFTSLMTFTALISLNLAVINILPIPALDGGRLLFVAIEAIRRRPIDPIWVARVNTAGFIALMLLMLVVTFHDVMRLL